MSFFSFPGNLFARHSFHLLLALLLLSGTVVADESKPSETVSESDLFIHPLCLSFLLFEGNDHHFTCEEGWKGIRIEKRELKPILPGSEFPTTFYLAYHPEEEGRFMGYAGFSETVRWTNRRTGSELAVLEVSLNGGGTGTFSSIVQLEKTTEGEYLIHWQLGGGDRCNDGSLRVVKLSGHELIYAASATPFRLLNPTDESDWRSLHRAAEFSSEQKSPETLFAWKPYKDIANAATSCAGQIIHRFHPISGKSEPLGVLIDFEAFLSQTQGAIQSCINKWLLEKRDEISPGEEGWIPLDQWMNLLQTSGESCGS